jgi:hypothetical protein
MSLVDLLSMIKGPLKRTKPMLSRRTMIASGAAALVLPGLQLDRPAQAQLGASSEGMRGRGAPAGGAAGVTPVRINDTVFTADDPAAIWQDAGLHTTRIFLRKGNWAIIWYLQERSPVDGKPFDVVVVERQRWYNLATERPALSYQANVFGRSFPLAGHGDFQRWVIASRSFPMSDRVLDQWQYEGWLLPWGTGPKLRAPSQWGSMDPIPAYTPLSKGGINPGMGTTGLRDEVGPIVNRQARYVMERSAEMRRIALNYGLSAASIPWHVRGSDGLPLLLDKPNMPLKVQQYYQNYPEEKIISISPGMQYDWQIDNAHRPCLSFIPALLSELHPFFVEEQVFSACTALNSVTPDYRGTSGKLIDEGQGRDWAWSMRDILLAHALLKSMPPVDWMPKAERFDAILSANLDRAMRAMAMPGIGQLGMFWGANLSDDAPNPDYWAAVRTGQRPGVYTGCIADYTAFTLDWGRRLHPDPRWLQLQVQYAQRFQARRFLATGPFCFLNLPTRLDGNWASSWDNVAKSMGLPQDIARQRWHSFDKPVYDPAVYPYTTEYPTTFYNGLKLAQATGQAGVEVDNAITLLEAQMGGRAFESWPAFSMLHAN